MREASNELCEALTAFFRRRFAQKLRRLAMEGLGVRARPTDFPGMEKTFTGNKRINFVAGASYTRIIRVWHWGTFVILLAQLFTVFAGKFLLNPWGNTHTLILAAQ